MSFEALKENISKAKKINKELSSLSEQLEKSKNAQEKGMISMQISSLQKSLKQSNQEILGNLEKINVPAPLTKESTEKPTVTIQETPLVPAEKSARTKLPKKEKAILDSLEKVALKRITKKKKEKKEEKKARKASGYVKMANKMFSGYSRSLLEKDKFQKLETSIIRSKIAFIPHSYISVLFFTVFLSIFVAFFLFFFFLIFNFGAELPIITFVEGSIVTRFLKVFWILFIVPIATSIVMYIYPSLEQKAAELKINQELPFATIHMSAISGSMVDSSKIFGILVATKEYPNLEKEFNRLINEVDLYGYNLVTALKNVAENSPSRKLSELFTGLATTISSGGDLTNFFEKRSESLLFDYRLAQEKSAKAAETFMDIYISVVIAAPMILMLLLIMMKISGLGISFSTSTITLMTILGVFFINIVFLTFLHLKQGTE